MSMRAGVLRVAIVAGVVVVLALLSAAPASAHTISGPKPTNFRSHVISITPEVPGVTARVVDLGAKLELTNRTDSDVTVLGYEDEPYLRIGPSGVFENVHSQATYINRSLKGATVPVGVDTSPTTKPEWRKISDARSYRWHDHRIHWMGAQLPPTVAAAPGQSHHLSTQRITFVHEGQRSIIAVALDWVPGPSAWPWIIPMALLFVVGLVLTMKREWWRALAILLAFLVVCDIAHAISYEIARPGPNTAKTAQFFAGSFVSVAVWIAAVPTVIALWRRRVEAMYGVAFVGFLIALVGGLSDLSLLWKSQLPGVGPHWLTRLEVVVALGLGSGLGVGALIHMFRGRRPLPEEDGGGRWLSLLVAGLSDGELARIVRDLDADEVLEVACRDLAARATPIVGGFQTGGLLIVADDCDPIVAWAVAAGETPGTLRAKRGRVEPVRLELRAPFAALLQLLAGTLTVDDALARSLLTAAGDAAFLDELAPYLPEVVPTTSPATDRAPAS
jgi:hypothetical protein